MCTIKLHGAFWQLYRRGSEQLWIASTASDLSCRQTSDMTTTPPYIRVCIRRYLHACIYTYICEYRYEYLEPGCWDARLANLQLFTVVHLAQQHPTALRLRPTIPIVLTIRSPNCVVYLVLKDLGALHLSNKSGIRLMNKHATDRSLNS